MNSREGVNFHPTPLPPLPTRSPDYPLLTRIQAPSKRFVVRFFPSAKRSYRGLSRRNIFHGDLVRRARRHRYFLFFFLSFFASFFLSFSLSLPTFPQRYPPHLLTAACFSRAAGNFIARRSNVIAVLTGYLKKINLNRSYF